MIQILRNPVLYLAVAALLMIKCEFMFIGHFGFVMREHPQQYLGILVLTLPLQVGLIQLRAVKRWQRSSNISSAVGLQVNRNMTGLVLLTYGIVYLVLGLTWRASQ